MHDNSRQFKTIQDNSQDKEMQHDKRNKTQKHTRTTGNFSFFNRQKNGRIPNGNPQTI